MIYNKTELRKIANNFKKELNKLPQIDDNGVYEVAKKLGFDWDSCEDNHWNITFDNGESNTFSGRITKADAIGIDEELSKWYEGNKIVEDSIVFDLDLSEKVSTISCYVWVDVWFKYPVYNDKKEVLLFEINL